MTSKRMARQAAVFGGSGPRGRVRTHASRAAARDHRQLLCVVLVMVLVLGALLFGLKTFKICSWGRGYCVLGFQQVLRVDVASRNTRSKMSGPLTTLGYSCVASFAPGQPV